MIKKWQGSQTHCDLCTVPLSTYEWFADAKVTIPTNQGITRQWALVCPICHSTYTKGKFGTGIGQKYDSITKIKLEG